MSSPGDDIINIRCSENRWEDIWFAVDTFILITGAVANGALLWLFLRERKTLSTSQVLGLNLVVMDLIYLSVMPFNLIYIPRKSGSVDGNNSAIAWQPPTASPVLISMSEISSMFNLVGCPLLLACMCVERYLAVVRPVLYLRVRKWEYRMAVSAVVWAFTLSFCLAAGLMDNIIIIMLPVSIIISCLFCLMLVCLGGVIWSLQKQSPAHTSNGNQVRSESPLKRRAVGNVLLVVVLAGIAYLPVLVFCPMVFFFLTNTFSTVFCILFELSWIFPVFGVFIGPLFYLSKARQMCCPGKTE